MCFLNYWIFHRFLNSNYLKWYVGAGPFIGLATAAFGAAWGKLDNITGLISAHPLYYAGTCCMTAGLPIYVFGGHLGHRKAQTPLESIAGSILVIFFVVAALSWLIFIAPVQYFVFLICGSLARMALSSTYRVHARIEGAWLRYEDRKAGDEVMKGGWDASMVDKPVTITNAFAAAVLFIIGQFWS
jgi:hypothetical protein